MSPSVSFDIPLYLGWEFIAYFDRHPIRVCEHLWMLSTEMVFSKNLYMLHAKSAKLYDS